VPQDWDEPVRWSALPRGERTDEWGSRVGFPKTVEGAVGMAAAANSTAIEGDVNARDEQLRIYHSYLTKANQVDSVAEEIEMTALDTDKRLARLMGVKPGQPLPAGGYLRSVVVGYKIIEQSPGEVSVWLLGRAVTKTGETAKESTDFTRTLVGVQWQDGDWKLTADSTARALRAVQGKPKPEHAAPGDPKFNAAGWTAIREAS
ncbi:hypothetical protein AB0G74_30455, partial [Streptomyces sp. NPDC020875]|uniref:hypothetical protein n=1 Tax=Streptomyces sp. NPDC020875 TaxID=3154898 RepID=UPI0033C30101